MLILSKPNPKENLSCGRQTQAAGELGDYSRSLLMLSSASSVAAWMNRAFPCQQRSLCGASGSTADQRSWRTSSQPSRDLPRSCLRLPELGWKQKPWSLGWWAAWLRRCLGFRRWHIPWLSPSSWLDSTGPCCVKPAGQCPLGSAHAARAGAQESLPEPSGLSLTCQRPPRLGWPDTRAGVQMNPRAQSHTGPSPACCSQPPGRKGADCPREESSPSL
ncbi:uncharacterized protein LOC106007704 isoform X3 [Heterocephalus glaber]|uniref:Uncharacterized protein LOC106007704 isoform X3 n=1 Tax=Heterocephalus glaber TaxID=10181 RepID=A0AAX6RP37_HETGA|nr:uncharacterized protein LOC106007704 isoform X3 [Heterocephalus glaber]